MASLNKCAFIGNVGRIETKYMPNGDPVTSFSLACNETWKDKNGDKKEKTEWINCIAYRKLAEIIGEYVKTGQSLYVEGKMQTRQWDKDGVKHYSTEIIVNEMQMLGVKKEESTDKSTAKPAAKPAQQGGSFSDMDDNIPFSPFGKSGAGVSWRSM